MDEVGLDARVRAVTIRPRGGFRLLSGFEPAMGGHGDVDAAARWLVPTAGRAEMEIVPLSRGARLLADFDRLGTDLSAEAVVEVADRRGWLTRPISVHRVRTEGAAGRPADPNAPKVIMVGGSLLAEQFAIWTDETLRLKALRQMWRSVVAAQTPSASNVAASAARDLDRVISRARGNLEYVLSAESNEFSWHEVRGIAAPDAVLRQLPARDLAALARFVVGREINRSLAGQVDVKLLPLQSREIRQVPRTLLAAIYLEFAIEVAGGTRFRVCALPGCGATFSARANQRFHSVTCKNAANYLARATKRREDLAE